MNISKIKDINRRAFMKRSSQLAGMGVAAPFAMNMALTSQAAAFSAPGNDYRALVCIFLEGGNDHNNMLIPVDNANYDIYHTARGGGAGRSAGGIARAQADIINGRLNPAGNQRLTNDVEYALAPEMPLLKQLFDERRMGIQLNVGTLVRPLTGQEFRAMNGTGANVPPRLFSHNDQRSIWQSSSPEGASSGWGGRLADLAQSTNTNTLFTAISPSGNSVFLTGREAVNYQITTGGAIRLEVAAGRNLYNSRVASDMLREIISDQRDNIFEGEYNRVTERSISSENVFNSAIRSTNINTQFNRRGNTSNIAAQLQVVAQTIAARRALGTRRQIFFVTMGGYDVHNDLIENHAELLRELDFAMHAFYRTTEELGVANEVTTFTGSDFGRALASNGDGCDHGWGGHHFVMGGDVRGGRYFGEAPEISLDGDGQVGQGRLLPTTAVDEFGATLTRWFGASNSDLRDLFPNIGNFSNTDLGFMR